MTSGSGAQRPSGAVDEGVVDDSTADEGAARAPVRVRVVGDPTGGLDAACERIAGTELVVVHRSPWSPAVPSDDAAAGRVDLTVVVAPVDGGVTAAVERLVAEDGAGRVAVLAAPDALTPADLLAALIAGADGWLSSDLSTEALHRSLLAVAGGEPGLARHHVSHLISALRHPDRPIVTRRDGAAVILTDRQWAIMLALAAEPSTRAMAERLCVSESTVRWHLARLAHVLRLPGRGELAALAADLAAADPARTQAAGPTAGEPAARTLLPTLRSPYPAAERDPAAGARDPAGLREPPGADEPFRAGWAQLSAGERRTVQLVALGLTNREIALQHAMSRHTVDTQVKRAFGKLGVRSRVELTRALLHSDL